MAKTSKKTTKANVAPAIVRSNLPSYTFDNAIVDSLQSKATEGKAESGMLTALFLDEKWNVPALRNYFKPDKIKGVATPSRRKVQEAILSTCAVYKASLADLKRCEEELDKAEKTNPVDAVQVAQLNAQQKKLSDPILATNGMLHRAMTALYQCRVNGYISVTLGENNELTIVNKDGKTVITTISSVRKAGDAFLKKEGFINARKPRPTETTPPPANGNAVHVSKDNVFSAMKLVSNFVDKMGDLPIGGTNVGITQAALADQALHYVLHVKREATIDADVRAILTKIAMHVNSMLTVKTVEAVKPAKKKAA